MLRRILWTRRSRLLTHQPPITRSFHQSSSAMMARILCSDPIDPICPELLRAAGHDVTCDSTGLSHTELITQVPDYDVLIVRSGSKVDRQVPPPPPPPPPTRWMLDKSCSSLVALAQAWITLTW
ncbi:unnamed protein product [Peronospora farinosa]|uniref:D-isomer specific 2-hydroxyacid dehydrogenase catalytic domain-containing protein n=1 Tax=Peronospora farinosa TaxID=134698 RepID=A0AAV0TFN3_9STRA|nr:unnamed protein product [Peronospora farinosa]